MQGFYARAVFFVEDAERSLSYYTESLGFAVDWNHKENERAFVFQVSLWLPEGQRADLDEEPMRD